MGLCVNIYWSILGAAVDFRTALPTKGRLEFSTNLLCQKPHLLVLKAPAPCVKSPTPRDEDGGDFTRLQVLDRQALRCCHCSSDGIFPGCRSACDAGALDLQHGLSERPISPPIAGCPGAGGGLNRGPLLGG